MSVTLYTPDEAPLVLKLHLPPTTATVAWHGASFGHPRAMMCRVHMYPVTDGFLSATHETPPILRFCFLQIDGAWHALDAFACAGFLGYWAATVGRTDRRRSWWRR